MPRRGSITVGAVAAVVGGGIGWLFSWRRQREADRQHRVQESLYAADRRHRELFDAARDAIFVADAETGIVVDANPAACALVGKSLEQLRGLHQSQLHPPEQDDAVRADFHEVRSHLDQVTEWDLLHADGRRIPVQISTGVFHGDDGRLMQFGVFRDLTQIRRTELQLRESETRFSSVFNAMEEMVVLHEVVFAADGKPADYRILGCNPAFTRSTGISKEQAVGRLASEVYEASPPPYLQEYANVAVSGKPYSFRTCYRPLAKHFQISVVPTGPARFATITWDITQMVAQEAALGQAKEAAEAANHAKDQFLATLSHELRTPLTPVLAMLSTLQHEPRLPEDLRADVQLMRRNIDLEAQIIGDLLDLTRITRGKLRLEPVELDAHETIRQAAAIPQAQIQEKRLRLDLHLDASRSWVRADPTRLQQIFWNIIQNAVTFTPDGGQISISTRNTPQGLLEVTCRDTGVGIAPEFLPRLFNAFEQDRGSPHTRRAGLGLGMTIAHSLVAMQGGSIHAASEGPGKGATFTVNLPAVDRAEFAVATPAKAENASRALRILLVEDHPSTLQVISTLLRRSGHQVFTAQSLREAVDVATKADFDLLLSDIGLPDGSGVDLPRMLGSRRPPYAIALSGYGMDSDLQSSREAGFDCHLVKPVDFSQLRAAIGRVTA